MLEGITEEKIREAEELIKRGYSEKSSAPGLVRTGS